MPVFGWFCRGRFPFYLYMRHSCFSKFSQQSDRILPTIVTLLRANCYEKLEGTTRGEKGGRARREGKKNGSLRRRPAQLEEHPAFSRIRGLLRLRLEAGRQSACAEANTRGAGRRAKVKREHCTPVLVLIGFRYFLDLFWIWYAQLSADLDS